MFKEQSQYEYGIDETLQGASHAIHARVDVSLPPV